MNATTTKLITRVQYDLLIKYCAEWMAQNWARFSRQWFLGGVQVTGRPHMIENLLAQIKWCETVPAAERQALVDNLEQRDPLERAVKYFHNSDNAPAHLFD